MKLYPWIVLLTIIPPALTLLICSGYQLVSVNKSSLQTVPCYLKSTLLAHKCHSTRNHLSGVYGK